MGHNKFQMYKNILILTKIFCAKDTSHTHDLKVCKKTWLKYLEHLVLCLFGEHTHTHIHTRWEQHAHTCLTESRLPGLIDRKLVYSLFRQLRGSYCSSSSTLHTSFKSTLFKKVSELMVFFFFFFLNII